MNKYLYRIVFNKARGIVMAVAENTRAEGKGSDPLLTEHGGASCQARLMQLRLIAFSAKIAVGAMACFVPVAHAQIVADPNAPASQRPTIVQTANGLPQVNIQAPSAAGVSRNTYSQFDVQGNGAILNNSRTSVQTQLGGWIQGNPSLAGGQARVILNEVNSSNPSQLRGYVEVAGQKAEVIIANPAGIQVNGGGFINADRVTLTTGTAVMNPLNGGSLESYRITRGAISIEGLGLDTRTADYTDILARSVEVNAGIWADRLKVVTGANQIDSGGDPATSVTPIAGTEPAPQFSLDVAALGGMYAGHIYLVGSEAGMGVRNQGTISAEGGDLVLLANGLLTNSGALQAAAINGSGGNLDMQVAGSINNAGTNAIIAGQKDVTLSTAATLNNSTGAKLDAGHSLTVAADVVSSDSTIGAADTVTLTAREIDNKTGGVISGNTSAVAATHHLTNRGLIDGREAVIRAGTLNNLGTGRLYGDHLALEADVLNNDTETVAGTKADAVIAARERLDIGVGTLNNRNGALVFSAGEHADALNIAGSLDAQGQAVGSAGTINNRAATIESLGGLSIAAAQLNNVNPDFSTRTSTTTEAVAIHYVRLGGVLYLESDTGRCFKCGSDRIDDGTPTLPRHEYVAPSAQYPFEAGYSRVPYQLYEYVFDEESQTEVRVNYQYPADSNVWALFGVPVGDQAALRPLLQSYNQNHISRAYRDTDHIWVTSQETIETVVDNAGTPGQIVSGGRMVLSGGNVLNDNSTILAGGNLDISGSSLTNAETQGNRQVTDYGTFRRDTVEYSPYRLRAGEFGSGSYVNVSENVTTRLDTSRAQGNTAASGSGTQVDGRTAPTSSLLRPAPDPAATYLYESDPRFTDYRQWLSSDYMLQALDLDPAAVQKRIGDGFYEQKLMREQIAQLTGRRFLDGYGSEEAQYQALMEAGVTYAKQWNLVPGVSLSAEQVAQLTSDIVWLVAQEVVLPDGTTTTALVPQVYIIPRDGDLDASGSLLAGQNVNIQLSGDLVNAGSIAGRSITQINADNVHNMGAIAGKAVSVAAQQDLTNLGGSIIAEDVLAATAGRDLVVQSTTSSASASVGSSSSSRTQVDRVAGLYVTKDAGILVASAGNDLSFLAGVLSSKGDIQASAGNNVNLGTVQTDYASDLTADARNYIRESGTQEVGSQIMAGGNVGIVAGNDLNARGAVVSATGDLAAAVGGNIQITEARATSESDDARYATSSGFLSKSSIEIRQQSQNDMAIASELGGKTVTLTSGNDTLIRGANVIGDEGLAIAAGKDLTIEAATNTSQSSSFNETKKSGLFSSGGLSVTYGKQEMSTDQDRQTSSAVASTVGSVDGNVVLVAGQTYTQKGSDVLAPGGDIDISARTVDILAAEDTYTNTTEQRFKQSGLTLAITSPVISAIQTVQQMAEAASNTKDGRMQALAGASAALAAKGGYDAIQKGQGITTADGKTNQMLEYDSAGEVTGSRDATAAERAGGINLSISIGGSKSEGKTTQSGTQAVGSTVTAGGDVRIVAAGAGEDSNVTIQGSNIAAGNDLLIAAENKLNLVAAQSTDEQHSNNKSSSGSLGISFGTDGIGVTASASSGRGNADGSDVIWTNTHVNAGNQLALVSGGDANLIGAVASGKQVVADVGGNLNIESLQDTSQYDSKQKNVGGSITIGAGVSGSISYSKSNIHSDYASVTEQSGIKAGDGGFQVNVQGNTDLKGAVIASTEQAVQDGNNSFQTASLTMSDIENKAEYKADAKGVSLGAGSSGGVPNLSGGGVGSDDGHAASTTQSGISGVAGNEEVRTGDAETGIAKIFDAEKVQKEINAQVQITQTFSQQASKAVADYVQTERKVLREELKEALKSGDDDKRIIIQKQLDDLLLQERVMNVLIGALTGSVESAVTKESLSTAADKMREITIENSSRFKGIIDGKDELSNFYEGKSEGIRGDGKGTGGTRVDLDNICGKSNERCITEVDAYGNEVLALKDGMVQWKREGANGMSLYEYLDSKEGQDAAGATGGIQGWKGTLFGEPYAAGSWQDKLIEAFGGTHDFIGGQITGLYDEQGNTKRGMSEQEQFIRNRISEIALIPSTPFAMSELLPPEVWTGIAIMLKAAK